MALRGHARVADSSGASSRRVAISEHVRCDRGRFGPLRLDPTGRRRDSRSTVTRARARPGERHAVKDIRFQILGPGRVTTPIEACDAKRMTHKPAKAHVFPCSRTPARQRARRRWTSPRAGVAAARARAHPPPARRGRLARAVSGGGATGPALKPLAFQTSDETQSASMQCLRACRPIHVHRGPAHRVPARGFGAPGGAVMQPRRTLVPVSVARASRSRRASAQARRGPTRRARCGLSPVRGTGFSTPPHEVGACLHRWPAHIELSRPGGGSACTCRPPPPRLAIAERAPASAPTKVVYERRRCEQRRPTSPSSTLELPQATGDARLGA